MLLKSFRAVDLVRRKLSGEFAVELTKQIDGRNDSPTCDYETMCGYILIWVCYFAEAKIKILALFTAEKLHNVKGSGVVFLCAIRCS